MNRRTVLAGSGLALAAAGGGGYVYWSWSHSPTVPDGMTVETLSPPTLVWEESPVESAEVGDTRALIMEDEDTVAEVLALETADMVDFVADTDFDRSYLCLVVYWTSPSWDLYLDTLERDAPDTLHVETIIYSPWYEGTDGALAGIPLLLRITDDESVPSDATAGVSERTTPML